LLYTLARLGLFLACWALVWAVAAPVAGYRWTESTALLTALIALVISSVLSLLLLARLRDAVARHVQARAERVSAALAESRAKEDVD
jgi:membrane protein implicated in regulation of membrane protease activity